MKVLLVTQYFWPETFPINILADTLKKYDCDITVLTGQPNYPEGKIFKGYNSFFIKKEYHNGIRVLRVPIIARGTSSSVRLLMNYFSFMLSGILLGPFFLFREKFDIIVGVAQSPVLAVIPAIVLKKIKKIPLVTWVGDLWPESLKSTGHVSNSLIIRMVGKLTGWIYHNCDLILVQSATFREPILTLCNSAVVAHLPNPAVAVSAETESVASASLLLDEGFNVVYAGNIGKVQSLEMIVAAAELLQAEPDIRIVLIGSGSQSDWLKQEILKRKLTNIQIPGRFPASEIPEILKQADVLLVSLVKDVTMSLTIPSKIQAYMSIGKPILAAMDGEAARLITQTGAGIATPAEEPQELAKAILLLRNASAEEKRKMGTNALNYFNRHFESNAVGLQLISYLKETIEKMNRFDNFK